MLNNYKRYQSLKNNFNVVYKGYDLKYIIADDFVYCSYGIRKIDISYTSFKKGFFYSLNFTEIQKTLSLKDAVVFSFSNYGNDYRKSLESVMALVNKSVLLNDVNGLKRKVNCFNIIVSFIQVFLFNFQKAKISWKEKLYYFQRLVFYKNTIDNLESQLSAVNIKSFVPFLSCTFKDNLYCQFFRKRGIPSYGMQHGIHLSEYFYKNEVPLDVINIENFQADYLLAWGTFMKEVFKTAALDEERCLIAGNPKYFNNQKIQVQNQRFKKCIVCLARDIYEVENQQLLNIVSELKCNNIEIIIKLHPRSSEEKYQKAKQAHSLLFIDKTITIEESIATFQPDFAIVYNSTVYYDYYINNIIAFRFELNEKDIPFGMDDSFNSYEELIQLIKRISASKNDELNDSINTFINRFSILGVNNYAKILN